MAGLTFALVYRGSEMLDLHNYIIARVRHLSFD